MVTAQVQGWRRLDKSSGSEPPIETDYTSWFQIPLPTAVLLGTNHASLEAVHIVFEAGIGVIEQVVVYDGSRPNADLHAAAQPGVARAADDDARHPRGGR